MGFCLFNNVAIGAHACCASTHGLKRIAVIDFDVHHGNGTQDIFWNDAESVLRLHASMAALSRNGTAIGEGRCGQYPQRALAAGLGQRGLSRGIHQHRIARARFVLRRNSSSFRRASTHTATIRWRSFCLTEEDFAWATREICALAAQHCAGRVVSTLEGGYDLAALARSRGRACSAR